MQTAPRHPVPIRHARRAFTLVELAVVILISGILAATVIPAWNSMTGARQAAAAEEVERRLVAARSQAVAEGRPVGLRINPTAGTIQLYVIAVPGAAPTPAVGFDGQASPLLSIPASYPGATITGLVGGGGATTTQTLWFGFDGSPQLRDNAGVLIGPWTADATITLTGGQQVIVRRLSGLVQR